MQLALRHIIPVAVAGILLGACAGESYPGLTYDQPWSDDILNNESGRNTSTGIEIVPYLQFDSFKINDTRRLVETRGTGPFIVPERSIGDSNRYEKSIFHIFAFRDTLDAQGLPMPDYTRRSADSTDLDRNCLVDGSNYLLGIQAQIGDDPSRKGRLHFRRDNIRLDTTLYYGARTSRVGYNFYGCFIDDYRPTEATARRDARGICYDIDIDGTQDLMYGRSERITAPVLKELVRSENLLIDTTDEKSVEWRNILNIGNYCGYAAYHGVQPQIKLKHGLVRLRFRAYPADQSCDSVTIEDIQVYSKYKAHMWVVNDDVNKLGVTFDDDRRYLVLRDSNYTKNRDSIGIAPYEPLHIEGNTVNYTKETVRDTANWKNNVPTFIGGDLLVAPDSVYRIKLTYRQTLRNINKDTGENLINRNSTVYDFPAPEIAEARDENGVFWYLPSHTYYINIGVFGLRPIVITGGVDGWEEGEEIPPNTEDEFDGN